MLDFLEVSRIYVGTVAIKNLVSVLMERYILVREN